MTTQLFRHPEISALPERGAYTALESLIEWQDAITHALGRYVEWSGQPDKAGDIAVSAQRFFVDSAADLEKLMPFLETEEDAAAAHRVGELRDRLRELFGDDPAARETAIADNVAENIEAEAANLRASIHEQTGLAHTLMRQAGPPPLSDATRANLCEGWKCMARTIINTAELPGLDLGTIDALDTLIAAADALRAVWDTSEQTA